MVVARTGPSRWCDQVAVTRVHFSHQNADYWSLLLHHFAPRSGPPVRAWGQGAYLYLFLLLLSLSTQPHRSSSADCQSICFVPHPCRKHGPYHSHRSVTRPERAGWRCPVAAALASYSRAYGSGRGCVWYVKWCVLCVSRSRSRSSSSSSSSSRGGGIIISIIFKGGPQVNGGYRVDNSRGAPRWSTALYFAAPWLKPLNSM